MPNMVSQQMRISLQNDRQSCQMQWHNRLNVQHKKLNECFDLNLEIRTHMQRRMQYAIMWINQENWKWKQGLIQQVLINPGWSYILKKKKKKVVPNGQSFYFCGVWREHTWWSFWGAKQSYSQYIEC